MSTYYPAIPPGTQNPSVTAPLLRSNFTALDNAIARNHTDMTDTANSGKHEFLQMPEQGAAPTTVANEGGVYTKAVSGATELFYREESSGTERQLTSAFLGATNGYALIPGGLLMKWGSQTGVKDGIPVVFPTGGGLLAFGGTPYNVQLTIIQNSSASNTIFVRTTGISATQFTPSTKAGELAIYWTAIGPQ